MYPNLKIALDCSHSSYVHIGYDAAGKYYVLQEIHNEVRDGVHLEAQKTVMLSIDNAKKLRDDLVSFFGAHEKYK